MNKVLRLLLQWPSIKSNLEYFSLFIDGKWKVERTQLVDGIGGKQFTNSIEI